MKKVEFEDIVQGKFIAIWKYEGHLWCADYLVDNDGALFLYLPDEDRWEREDRGRFKEEAERLGYKIFIAKEAEHVEDEQKLS